MADRPNVVQISCHDVGQHLGCYGVDTARTPNVDRVAEEGVRFENSFCVAPQCSPSRASIATGRYPHCNGVMGLAHANFAWDLNDDETHVAERLSAAGYHAALSGFQHETRSPADVFDEVVALPDDCEPVAEATAAHLRERADEEEPFYLQVGFVEPHRKPGTPGGFGRMPEDLTAEATVPEYLVDDPDAREEFVAFEGAVHRVDAAIGEVLDALDATGQADDTLVVVTTDHGIPFPRAKCSPYDPGIETALLLRWPGELPAGEVCESTVRTVDHLPTLFDLAGLDVPENVQGESLAAEVRSGETVERPVYGEMTYHDYCDPRRFVRADGYKCVVNFTNAYFFMDPTQTWRPRTVTSDPPEPALAYHDAVELYDLEADPGETENLARDPDHAGVREDLLSALREWMEATDDPLLDGIPTPPMHEMATEALETGEVPDPDDW
ncbi:MAG: sulfatase [Halobacteriaceae archaeon]